VKNLNPSYAGDSSASPQNDSVVRPEILPFDKLRINLLRLRMTKGASANLTAHGQTKFDRGTHPRTVFRMTTSAFFTDST